MEAVIFEDSPLAEYLEGDGGGLSGWSSAQSQNASSSPGSSPSVSYAPRGRPIIPSKYRQKLPSPLRLDIPKRTAAAAITNTCSKALNSRLDRVDNAKFLEQFRYIIVASQLLSGHSYHGTVPYDDSQSPQPEEPTTPQVKTFTTNGAIITASVAFGLAWVVHWSRSAPNWKAVIGRLVTANVLIVALAVVGQAYLRRQWLHYLRQQNLSEARRFVANAHELDSAMTAAMSLIQEVELVSRGYRMLSLPLPPITRLEDRSQTRRCVQLRRALFKCLRVLIPLYNEACEVLLPLTELLTLEKYYDVYDMTDLDLQEAKLGYTESEFEDSESLRVLKILVSRFIVSRKIFLCCLLALDADGGRSDLLRWRTAIDEVKVLSTLAAESEGHLRKVLEQEEAFPVPSTPKIPLTPGRERWRGQLRKLNTLSTGIRSLQAKLHVLREESDKTLNQSEDLSELGPNLMIQYDAIGVDLRALMQEWEAGKAALANNIDRNERRISSMSGMMSPTISLSGLTSVEEGGPAEALKALNGEDRSGSNSSRSDTEEVFEAIALQPPRLRSSMSRDERIQKMKEERANRESKREKAEANTSMLRELESVINLRPRRTAGSEGGTRVTSL